MATQITIIGLGQVGASIGLALGAHKDRFVCIGHDKNMETAHQAQKKGAVDRVSFNLPSSVEGSQIVVLALPLSQIQDTLRYVSQDVPHGALVLDTAPVKSEVAKWAAKYLPSGRHYVGLMPAINPEFLTSAGAGLESAKADLFTRGLFMIDVPLGTPGEVVELTADFIRLLGATPLFTDMLESDGLSASTHVLPQLLAACLLNSTIDQPGWQEGRKLASRAFAAGTAGMADHDDVDSLSMAVLQNRESTLHKLNSVITSLFDLREAIESGDESTLTNYLKQARTGRARWLDERAAADWTQMKGEQIETQSLSERMFGTLFSRAKKKE
ncbi:MAG: prephenate dehydrogenase/arogenate dehydrogenase family protein [Chloroflexota bacterium]